MDEQSRMSAAKIDELEAAWAAEAEKVEITLPPEGVRPPSATTIIDGKPVTDQERREKTRHFIAMVSDPDRTTHQEARDLIYAAVKQRTLKPHHLERIIGTAPATSPHNRSLVRALLVVDAAMNAADELEDMPLSEYAANDHVLNLMLYRMGGAALSLAAPLAPMRGPDELMEIVGTSFVHEPQWWLAARMEARGCPFTIPHALDMLEKTASRQKQLYGTSQALRANRVEFVERQRQAAAAAAGEQQQDGTVGQPARAQAAHREPSPDFSNTTRVNSPAS